MFWWPPRTGTWDAAFQIERYHWLVEGEPSVYLLADSTATSHPGNTTVETRENFESTWAFNSFFVFKNVLPLIFLWLTLLPKEGESSSRIAILVCTTVFRITQIECSFVSSAFSDFSQTYRCYLCRRKCLLFVVIIRMLKAVKKYIYIKRGREQEKRLHRKETLQIQSRDAWEKNTRGLDDSSDRKREEETALSKKRNEGLEDANRKEKEW